VKIRRISLSLQISALLTVFFCGGVLRAWAAPAATTTTLAVTSGGNTLASGGSIASGSVVSLTATVTASGSSVTVGQVSFCDASATYCTDIHLLGKAQLTSAGKATLNFIPGIGSHSYKAVFAGAPNGVSPDAGSASSIVTLTVTGTYPTATTIAASGNAGDYSLTATVTGSGGAQNFATLAGTVSFLDTTNANLSVATAEFGTVTPGLSFLNSSNPTTGDLSGSIVAGDFNGDGIPDLAVANYSGNTLSILLGNGDGTFTPAANSPIAVTFDPQSIVVGDFNGDGKADLAMENSFYNGVVTVLLGNGDGTFTPAANSPILVGGPSETSGTLAVGDFNGDGIPDLIVANMENVISDPGAMTVLLGNGDGTFTKTANSPVTVGSAPISISVGDFNGDGMPDLAIVNFAGNNVTILLSNGNGTFTQAANSPIAVGGSPWSVTVGDLNRDGILDLAVANSNYTSGVPGTVTILLGNGNGTFTPALNSPVAVGYDPHFVVVGDFNGDGKADLAVANNPDYTVTILQGNGDGTFTPAMNSPVRVGDFPESIAVADFNGNGISDLAVTNWDNTANMLLSQLTQTATATATGISPLGTGTHQVEASYPGNSNYAPSISSTTGLTAQQGKPTVNATPASASITTAQSLTVTVAVSDGIGNPTPTGSVTLTSGSYSSAATSLSNGSATISLPAGSLTTGTDTLTVSYTGDANYIAATGSASIMVTIPVTPTFSVSGTAVTLAPGATTANISTVTVTPVGAFTGGVVLTASITSSPAGAIDPPTFSFGSSSPVTITGNSAGAATLTITTTPATSSALTYPMHRGVPWYAASGTTLACVLLLGIPARRRSWQTMFGILVLFVALAGGMLGCSGAASSGGSGNHGTTAGAYTVTVTGTSGATTAVGTVTLTVQ